MLRQADGVQRHGRRGLIRSRVVHRDRHDDASDADRDMRVHRIQSPRAHLKLGLLRVNRVWAVDECVHFPDGQSAQPARGVTPC